MPMVNDSTALHVNLDIKKNRSPRPSSIIFIKQFARVYMATDAIGSVTISLN